MELKEFNDFIYCEMEKIKIDKWIEGEKLHKDPGVIFEIQWVENNAKGYRIAWEHSMCRTCVFRRECGFNTLSSCEKYKNG